MSDLPNLTLPSIDARIEWIEEKRQIWDVIRKQWVVLTPEEWVRQHFIHLLIEQLAYPKSLLKIESGFKYGKKSKRSDIQVYKPNGRVFLLVECKAPSVSLDDKTVKQVAEYNKTLQSDYLSISNGLKHFIWKFISDENRYESLTNFPEYFPD